MQGQRLAARQQEAASSPCMHTDVQLQCPAPALTCDPAGGGVQGGRGRVQRCRVQQHGRQAGGLPIDDDAVEGAGDLAHCRGRARGARTRAFIASAYDWQLAPLKMDWHAVSLLELQVRVRCPRGELHPPTLCHHQRLANGNQCQQQSKVGPQQEHHRAEVVPKVQARRRIGTSMPAGSAASAACAAGGGGGGGSGGGQHTSRQPPRQQRLGDGCINCAAHYYPHGLGEVGERDCPGLSREQSHRFAKRTQM